MYRSLFDDAALFPPGNAPMGEALPAHRGHRTSSRAAYVGPFLVSDARVAELRAVLSREDGDHPPLGVVVTVPGGADGVAPAVEAVLADPALRLRGLEVAAPPGGADGVAAVLNAHLPDGSGGHERVRGRGVEVSRGDSRPSDGADRHERAEGYVEVSRGGGPEGARADLAALASAGLRAKFRTGGVTAQAHPDEDELAAYLYAAVDLGVPFKCTAGLHHAVRHTTAEGFEQHGFLNVLLATDTLVRGGSAAEAAAVLADRDGGALAARAKGLTAGEAASVRAAFRSFGTCSIIEPLEDLIVLGALSP
ncbi:hypothetical protein K1J57_24025 [Nocardiopsis sp. MT53]|uniref:Uncharacterized protein n=1 Tax=Nocardiopsis changdeensis TaxID=2831969 RepID=A0ABX8BYU2_9ACTN|nr:hypothetical protein KGD84_14570 [Nocardiopsis changdeensis]QYX40436.1 hypothetical protein K1J57_24025 [Nocardiopsis sp. MT53]